MRKKLKLVKNDNGKKIFEYLIISNILYDLKLTLGLELAN